MGWDVGSTGMKIVLGAEVPELVEKYLADDVDKLLSRMVSTIARHRPLDLPSRRPEGDRGDPGPRSGWTTTTWR